MQKKESFFLTRPVLAGILFALLTLLAALLGIFVPTYFIRGADGVGFLVGLVLLLLRLIVFLCMDIQAHAVSDTWKTGCRYAATWLLFSAAMIGGLAIFVANGDLGALEPHADWFAGLGYLIFFFATLVSYTAELLLAATVATVFWLRVRNHKVKDPQNKIPEE